METLQGQSAPVEAVILSRHPAAVDWLCRRLADDRTEAVYDPGPGAVKTWPAPGHFGDPGSRTIRVITGTARPDDVRGRHVYGVIPMALAALAARVTVIEFDVPPRGAEYTADDMDRAGARLVDYVVRRADPPPRPERAVVRPSPRSPYWGLVREATEGIGWMLAALAMVACLLLFGMLPIIAIQVASARWGWPDRVAVPVAFAGEGVWFVMAVLPSLLMIRRWQDKE